MGNPVKDFLIGLAAVAVVVGVGVYVAEHITCWHIPYIVHECVVSK